MKQNDLKPHEVQIIELSRKVEAHQFGELHVVFSQGAMVDLADSYHHRKIKICGTT